MITEEMLREKVDFLESLLQSMKKPLGTNMTAMTRIEGAIDICKDLLGESKFVADRFAGLTQLTQNLWQKK